MNPFQKTVFSQLKTIFTQPKSRKINLTVFFQTEKIKNKNGGK